MLIGALKTSPTICAQHMQTLGGVAKRMDELRIGDRVLSFDPTKGDNLAYYASSNCPTSIAHMAIQP